MPIYLYHRACFLRMLGMKKEARELFTAFIIRQSGYKTDDISKVLVEYEGSNVEQALLHATREA